MVEIFITDIQNEIQANEVSGIIQNENADLKINFDLNETDFSFPCGHTILRIEGSKINSDKILSAVSQSGFKPIYISVKNQILDL
jgi:hypothetical protein